MNEDTRKKAVEALFNRPPARFMLLKVIDHVLGTMLKDAPPEKRDRLTAVRDACRRQADALSFDGIRDLYERAAAKPSSTMDQAEVIARGGRRLTADEHRERILADPHVTDSALCALVENGRAEAWLVDDAVFYTVGEQDEKS